MVNTTTSVAVAHLDQDFNRARSPSPAHLASLEGCLCYESPGTGLMGGIHGVAGPSSGELPAQALRPHPQEPLYVLQSSGGHVDPAVEVLDPIDRNLAYAQATLLGQQEQLGIEEPLAVLDLGQQLQSYAALYRLEAALGVEEAVAEECLYEEVLAARDQLALPLACQRS